MQGLSLNYQSNLLCLTEVTGFDTLDFKANCFSIKKMQFEKYDDFASYAPNKKVSG